MMGQYTFTLLMQSLKAQFLAATAKSKATTLAVLVAPLIQRREGGSSIGQQLWAIWKLCYIGRDSSGWLLALLLLLALASTLGAIALGEELTVRYVISNHCGSYQIAKYSSLGTEQFNSFRSLQRKSNSFAQRLLFSFQQLLRFRSNLVQNHIACSEAIALIGRAYRYNKAGKLLNPSKMLLQNSFSFFECNLYHTCARSSKDSSAR